MTQGDIPIFANQWVEEFARGWSESRDAAAFAAHFRDSFNPDCRFRQPLVLGKVIGIDAWRDRFVGPTFELLTDARGQVEDWAVRGNTIYMELRVDAYVGGRPVTVRSCERITLRDGLWAERTTYLDSLPLIYAVLRAPRSWPTAVRLQYQNLKKGWRNR